MMLLLKLLIFPSPCDFHSFAVITPLLVAVIYRQLIVSIALILGDYSIRYTCRNYCTELANNFKLYLLVKVLAGYMQRTGLHVHHLSHNYFKNSCHCHLNISTYVTIVATMVQNTCDSGNSII